MHETSLIEFTLNAVEAKAQSMGITKVTSIHLTVGKMRGAIPLLMQEAFRILVHTRPIFTDAKLEIDEIPILVECLDCDSQSIINDFQNLKCPNCGSSNYDIITGNELKIDYFEGD